MLMSGTSSLDLFHILGIDQDAPADEVKNAYRRAARRFHPDVNPNQGAQLQFQEISSAYEILTDDLKLSRYKREREHLGELPGFKTEVIKSKRNLAVIKEPQVLYVLFDILPRHLKGRGKSQKSPLNIALVLDKSKSMSGPRLDRVKVAAHQVIDQFGPEDRISIIQFSDRADVIVPNTLVDNKRDIKSRVSVMNADGATAIFLALEAAYKQVDSKYDPEFVNHIVLVTDGRTFGDEPDCLELADEASQRGIGISAMGIGDEWNDEFLDELVGRTGGASAYINSPSAVVTFLNERVRNLSDAFAERVMLTVAPESDVVLESAFRLSPSAQPVSVDTQPIQLGALDHKRPISIMLQFQMPAAMAEGIRSVARLSVRGDVLNQAQRVIANRVEDTGVNIAASPAPEVPPPNIVDALSRMTLYRMHERTEEAIKEGNIPEATRRLENLSTRLLDIGQTELAQEAAAEARRIKKTQVFSEGARKNLKFGTRALLPDAVGISQE
jgi:Ca-activated chloride channel family protein